MITIVSTFQVTPLHLQFSFSFWLLFSADKDNSHARTGQHWSQHSWNLCCKCWHYTAFFPSSGNILLQEREPCHPIKLQKDLNSAHWLAHTVDAVATRSCKYLENVVHCRDEQFNNHMITAIFIQTGNDHHRKYISGNLVQFLVTITMIPSFIGRLFWLFWGWMWYSWWLPWQ